MEDIMRRLTIAAAAVVMLANTQAVTAKEEIAKGFHRVGKTMWTEGEDLVEVARFPLNSSSPTFRIMLEYVEEGECGTAEDQDCAGFDTVCSVFVELHPRAIPAQTDDGLELNREDVFWVSSFPDDHIERQVPLRLWPYTTYIVGGNNEGMVVNPHLIQAVDEQCMVGITAEYHKNYKQLFNGWPR
jgi:hypothetical protein